MTVYAAFLRFKAKNQNPGTPHPFTEFEIFPNLAHF